MKARILSLILAAIAVLNVTAGCSAQETDSAAVYLDHLVSETVAVADALTEEEPEETAEVPNAQEREESGEDKAEPTDEQGSEEPVVYADIEETAAVTVTAATAATTVTAATTTVITTSAVTAAAATKATTTAATAPPAPNPPSTVQGLSNDTFALYNTLCEKYKPASGKSCYLFNFSKSISSGFGTDGTVLPTEAEYGVKGAVNGRNITFTVYDHTASKSAANIYLQALDASCNNDYTDVRNAAKFSIDTASFTNGLYRIVVMFTDSNVSSIYFYINGNETWLCQQETTSESNVKNQRTRRADLITVLKKGGVTPENSLSLDKVWYPFRAVNEGERCDTQLWIDLSDTFIDDSWSDEHKLYAIQAWIRENLAYDNYVADTLKISRAQYYGDLTGKQSVYNSRAGVCFDYANIIAVMCRAHGIPAITIGTKSINHVWNAVYVNNRWIEYDAAMSHQYYVEKDTTVRFKTHNPLYGGIYSLAIDNTGTGKMPSDAEANKYFQYNSLHLY